MFGSEILEVAIGIVFVYVMSALVCSAFREGIAKLTNVRADTLEAEFVVHMLELNAERYLNFKPVDVELHHGFLAWHMVAANIFTKIRIGQDSLSLGFFDPDYLEELIEQNRIKISHIRLDNGILITARIPELQKFVIKYGDEEDAILDSDIFTRI
jgi:hypothetical protein